MRELLIVLLIAAVAYLAYDDFYRQRPALRQTQEQIQQVNQSPPPVAAAPRSPVYVPVNPPPSRPDWFRKRIEQGSSLDTSRQHIQKEERGSTPAP
jgi:hypothetical protein